MLPTAAVPSGEIAQITARILLEIEAVHFRPDDPFILTSGRASPVYIDCRKIISFPRARRMASTKFNLEPPSVARSSTSSTRLPSGR